MINILKKNRITLRIPGKESNSYGKYSFTVSAVESRNKIQKQLKVMLLKDLSPRKIKKIVSNFYLKLY